MPPSIACVAATVVTLAASAASTSLDAQARRPTAGPTVAVVADSFPMAGLGRARRIRVYLPPDYATSRRRHAVLYLQDGQNVFDDATSFAGEWGVDETLDSLHARGGVVPIVVAVDNDGRHRMDEYDPWRAREARLGGGEGDAYLAFLAGTLKPWIDARYRTRPGAATTWIGGSSMGGLIALAGALRRPDVFGGALVFSCACWVARDSILALARTPMVRGARPRLWFVVGGEETADDEPVHDQRAVVAALAAAGHRAGRELVAHERADGTHQEWFWRREFGAAIAWLAAAAR
jgi:metallo-beta-lactamase class B